LFSHPLLDWFTTFGTQLLKPFASTRFALDGIAIVDPVYTVILGLGLLGGRFLRGHPRAGWATSVALVLSTAYLMLGLRINGLAEQEAEHQLAAAGLQGYSVSAYPTMLQLPHRRVVAMGSDDVRVGYVSMWRPCEIEWGRAPVFTNANVEAVLATREGGIFAWFTGSRLIHREVADGDSLVIETVDLRYGYTLDPLDGLWIIRTRFDSDGNIVERPKRFSNRPKVTRETVGGLLADAFPESCETTATIAENR
jgi:inner membrane protein